MAIVIATWNSSSKGEAGLPYLFLRSAIEERGGERREREREHFLLRSAIEERGGGGGGRERERERERHLRRSVWDPKTSTERIDDWGGPARVLTLFSPL